MKYKIGLIIYIVFFANYILSAQRTNGLSKSGSTAIINKGTDQHAAANGDSTVSQTRWIGTNSGYWNEPANWSRNQVPGAGMDVTIDSSNVILTANASCRSITLTHLAKLTVLTGVDFKVTNGIPDSIKNNITLYSSPLIDTSKNILLITKQADAEIRLVNDSTLMISSLLHIKNLNRPSSGEQPVNIIEENDLLLADTTAKLPGGLMASVTSARQDSAGGWLINFVNASLSSLYKKLDYTWEKKLDTLQLKGGFSESIPVGSTSNKLTVSGSYQLYLTSGVSVQIEDAQLKKAEAKIEGAIVLSAKSALNLETFQKDTSITLKEIKLFEADNLYVGKIKLPFVFTGLLRVNLKIKANGTMQLSASYNYKNVSYVKLGFDNNFIPDVDGKFLEATVDTTAMVSKVAGTYSAGIEAQVKINFFKKNKTGLTAGLSASGVLEGNCGDQDQGMEVKGKLVVAGNVGGEIDLFGISTLQQSTNLFNYVKPLFAKNIDGSGICDSFPETPGTAVSHGDIHAISFDKRFYDFQSFGEFIMAKDGDFVMQSRQGNFGTDKRVTVNKAMVVTDGVDTVEFDVDSLKLFINKKVQPFIRVIGLKQRGYVERNPNNNSIIVQLSSGDRLVVYYYSGGYLDYYLYLTTAHQKKLRGILGNWNGSQVDDISLRNGTNIDTADFSHLYPAYANSWRISNAESLFTYPPGKSTVDYTDYSYPSTLINLSNDTVNIARNACIAAGITQEPALSNCIVDVGITGDSSLTKSSIQLQKDFTSTGPVIWLKLDGNTKDDSQWGNDAILVGNQIFTTDRKGKSNSALSLNGNNNYLDVPNRPSIKSLAKTLTVSGWIYVSGYQYSWAAFVCKSVNGEPNPLQIVLQKYLIGSGTVASNGVTTELLLDSLKSPVVLNTWYHVAMVVENGFRTYYFDGIKLVKQKQDVWVNEADLIIGADPYGATEYLNGALDDIRIYNRALTQTEILKLKNE